MTVQLYFLSSGDRADGTVRKVRVSSACPCQKLLFDYPVLLGHLESDTLTCCRSRNAQQRKHVVSPGVMVVPKPPSSHRHGRHLPARMFILAPSQQDSTLHARLSRAQRALSRLLLRVPERAQVTLRQNDFEAQCDLLCAWCCL